MFYLILFHWFHNQNCKIVYNDIELNLYFLLLNIFVIYLCPMSSIWWDKNATVRNQEERNKEPSENVISENMTGEIESQFVFLFSRIITWTFESNEERHVYLWHRSLMRVHLKYHPTTINWATNSNKETWERLIFLFFCCFSIVIGGVKGRYEAELCDSSNEITSWLRASSSFLSLTNRRERIHARPVLSTTAWMSKSCDIHSSISINTLECERNKDRKSECVDFLEWRYRVS